LENAFSVPQDCPDPAGTISLSARTTRLALRLHVAIKILPDAYP
jgi:hypothetical protein